MVSFEPLDLDEANAFLDESIREFLAERLPADHVDVAIVERKREELRQRLLPDGTLTSGHRFVAIVSNGERVGRVWFGPLQDDETDVYICDIGIITERRRKGHARAAIELILDHAAENHAARVGLTVTQANTSVVSFLGLLSPLVATIAGWMVLDQTLSIAQLIGASLILAAVIMSQRTARTRQIGTIRRSDTPPPAVRCVTSRTDAR